MANKNNFSFMRGWGQLRSSQKAEVKQKIMSALNLTVQSSFYYRLSGRCEPTVTEAEAIEKIFSNYGIKKNNIWGDR